MRHTRSNIRVSNTGQADMSRIIVGVDGSQQAVLALDWALAQAQRHGAQVVIAHTWQPDVHATPAVAGAVPDLVQDAQVNHEVEHQAQDWLDDIVKEAAGKTSVSVTGSLGTGSPAGHVLDLADDALMIVVGSRGRGGLRGLVLGSTSQQISSHAQCPVVVVREADAVQTGPVVVGVDGSPASQRALELAFAEAALRKTSLLLVHAWSTSFAGTLINSGQDFDRIRDSEVDQGWVTLNTSLSSLALTHGAVEIVERLVQGSPSAALIDASAGAVLTVVGSRGRGGFKGLMLGSVSAAVLQHAHSAVMVIRA